MSAGLEIEGVEPSTILISDLKIDPDLQCRAAGINKATVAEYAELVKAGKTVFPPCVAFFDSKGSHILADGFHRVAAASLAGLAEIACEVRQGSRKDALLFAAQANSAHGLRRTTADKRRAVLLVVGNFPKWSDRKIAEACGVDHKTVAAVKRSLDTPSGEIPQSEAGEQSASLPEQTDPDAVLMARLVKQAERLIAQCPEARRTELWERITNIFEQKTEPKIGEAS